jgi:hypothetical protein
LEKRNEFQLSQFPLSLAREVCICYFTGQHVGFQNFSFLPRRLVAAKSDEDGSRTQAGQLVSVSVFQVSRFLGP